MGEHKTTKKNFKLVSNSMHKKCSNTKFFLVRIVPHSDWIRRDTKSAKNFKITLAKTPWNSPPKKKFGAENKLFKTPYLKFIFYFRFFSTSFHNTVSLKKRRSIYDPQLTRHCKNDTPTTHRKTLLTLQVFQQTFLVSLRKKTFAQHNF